MRIAHAKLSPSAADRWTTCTAAPHMEADTPEQVSKYAQEGIEAHGLFERAIKAKVHPETLEPDHPAAKDVAVAYEQIEGFLLDPRFQCFSEIRVKLSPDVWGTADLIILRGEELWVIDYKHGKGVVVELPSIQLELYAIGALKSLEFMFEQEIKRVYTMVIQPRASHPDGPIRSIQNTLDYLRRKEAEIMAITDKINKGDVEFCPGEKQCKFSKASGNCKAQADAALEQARSYFDTAGGEAEGETVLVAPAKDTADTLSVEEQTAVVLGAKFVRDFLSAVEDRVVKALEAGQEYPRLKLVAGRSLRKWGRWDDKGNVQPISDDNEIMDYLVSECKLKKSDIAPPKLLGPAGVEKLIDLKKRNGTAKLEKLNEIIVKPPGKPTIVSVDDPRPGIQPHFKPVETDDPLA